MSSNRRFSLLSLLLIVSLVATCMGWFVARKQVELHKIEIETLQAKHSELRESTGQIDASDSEKIYVRNLETAAFGVYPFRVAIPVDMRASLQCRYEVDGQPARLTQSPVSVFNIPISPEVNEESHIISELTIYLKRNPDSWTIASSANGPNVDFFGTVRDKNLLWLDNMRESVPLNETTMGNENDPLDANSLAELFLRSKGGRNMGISFDTQSFVKSEEILLQEIWGTAENENRVIRFVISPHSDDDGETETEKDEMTKAMMKALTN